MREVLSTGRPMKAKAQFELHRIVSAWKTLGVWGWFSVCAIAFWLVSLYFVDGFGEASVAFALVSVAYTIGRRVERRLPPRDEDEGAGQ